MHQQQVFQHKKLSLAVQAAVLIISGSVSDFALAGTCSDLNTTAVTTAGVSVSKIQCVDGNSTKENTSVVNDTTAIANKNLATVSVEGLGNTFNNSGEINNNSTVTGITTSRTRTAIIMGDYTVARNGNAAAGSGGSNNTIQLSAASSTLTAQQLIGKKIVLAGVVVDGEARPGETATIIAYNPTTQIATVQVDNATGNWVTNPTSGKAYNIVAGSGLNTVNNNAGAKITATIAAAEVSASAFANTSSAKGISGNVSGDYVINNNGLIKASHAGVGGVIAVEGGGDVTSLTVNNSGTIAVERTGILTLGSVSATGLTAKTSTNSALAAANIGGSGAINTQEELESFTLNNKASGVVEAIGAFTPAIYMRAEEQVIHNAGIIRNTSVSGFAIGSVSDSGEIRTLELDNSGTITGDILAVNGQAQRWHALSTLGTLDSRLNINSQWGQLDSTIENTGTITGNLYFSNGTHELTNAQGAVLTGNIDLDQRDTGFTGSATTCTASATVTCPTAGSTITNPGENTKVVTTVTVTGSNGFGNNTSSTPVNTVVGTKNFTFENAGTFNGNLTIRTASSTALGGSSPVISNISLIPTITGSGSGSTSAAPSASIAGLGNTLNLITTAGGSASNVTIKPQAASGVVIKDGEFFKAATNYQINSATVAAGASTLPLVESSNSLIEWSLLVNASGNLVLASEVDVNAVAGLSSNSSKALAQLVTFDSDLGNQIQNLESDEEVKDAAEQLLPEVNGASVQASMASTSKVLGLVEARIGETQLAMVGGQTGVATGEQAKNVGIWMQGFGYTGEQDKRKSISGYDIDGYGFALGADTAIDGANSLRVGAAFGYANSNVDDQGVRKANGTDIDSYQGTIYASWLMPTWYLNGSLSLTQHDYDSKRVVIGNTINADFDGWQYSAKLNAGWPMAMGKVTLVPMASVAYSRLDIDGYKEKGEGALKVSSNDIDSFSTGLGAKALIGLSSSEKLKTNLEVRAMWNHEFGDTERDSTARFAAGGASFSTNGLEIDRDSANIGASLNLSNTAKDIKQSLSVRYDAEIRSGYLSHTGLVEARFDF